MPKRNKINYNIIVIIIITHYEPNDVSDVLFHPRRIRGSWSGQNEVNGAEIVAAKVFYKCIRAPGKRVSPDHFQATLRMLAPD